MRALGYLPFFLLAMGCGPTTEDKRADSLPKYSPIQCFVKAPKYAGLDTGGYASYYLDAQPEFLRTERVSKLTDSRGETESRYRFLYGDDAGDHYAFQVTVTYNDKEDVISESKEFVYDGTVQVLFEDEYLQVGIRPEPPEESELVRKDLERRRKEVERQNLELRRRRVNATS